MPLMLLPVGEVPFGQLGITDDKQVLGVVVLRCLGEVEGAGQAAHTTPRLVKINWAVTLPTGNPNVEARALR